MKSTMNSAVLAAMLMGLASGELKAPSATDGNRLHKDRAPDGSPEAQERVSAAAAKRARKLARAAK